MTLKEVYRLALARGMTAKQAGAEFKVKHDSLQKIKARHGFPCLISEYEFAERDAFKRMSDREILSYVKSITGSKVYKKELNYAKSEIQSRGLKV